ncbi:hypothetical protein QTP88_007298 [Uroleucon formosanum]
MIVICRSKASMTASAKFTEILGKRFDSPIRGTIERRVSTSGLGTDVCITRLPRLPIHLKNPIINNLVK